MSLVVRRSADAVEYLRRVESFLLADEATHCLTLGICANLAARPDTFGPSGPYLATVEDANRVLLSAIMTPPHRLVLSLVDPDSVAPRALGLLAHDLRSDRATLPGVSGPSPISGEFAEQWRTVSGQVGSPKMKERIYELDAVAPVPAVAGQLRRGTAADRVLLRQWSVDFAREALGEDEPLDPDRWVEEMLTSPTRGVFIWEDGEPVTMVSFGGPTPHGMRIGPVYTPPEHRRRGYATAATAAVSQWLLEGGRRYCFLFTDQANPTSNRIYQAIGYRPVCDVDVIVFR